MSEWVPKKTGKVRICFDLKPLNEWVMREVYGVPFVPILYEIHYMYMWAYIYICEPTFIYVGLHLYMWAYIYICEPTFIYVGLHLYMWAYIYICGPTFINVNSTFVNVTLHL